MIEPPFDATAPVLRKKRRSGSRTRVVTGFEAGAPPENPPGGKGLAIRDYLLVFLAVAAPLLGGCTALWAQGFLAAATGLTVCMFPPQRSLGRYINCGFVLLALLPLTAFLPLSIGGIPSWRLALPSEFVGSLGQLRTPQPWITCEQLLLAWLDLVIAYCALAHPWSGERRKRAVQIYAAGILGISIVFIVAYSTRQHVFFWPADSTFFGFFRNRNHTGNVLALSGIMMTGLAIDELRKRRLQSGFWIAGMGCIVYALICNYSRAGILLFFGGALILLIWSLVRSSGHKPVLLGLNAVLILLVLFFIFGGQTLERFNRETLTPFSSGKDYRLLIHRDALALSLKAPFFGVGLGNFAPVFSLARDSSADPNMALHPESDWLWSAVELGWLAPLTLAVGLAAWLRRTFPWDEGKHCGLRRAAVVAVLGFACHSLYDVAGHRLGAAVPALFLASIALAPNHQVLLAPRAGILFRPFGMFFVGVGAWWIMSAQGARVWPTSRTAEEYWKQGKAASQELNHQQALALYSEALKITPLNWELLSERGRANAVLGNRSRAVADFEIAQKLQPFWPNANMRAGNVWLALHDWPHCLEAWRDVLRRSKDDAAPYYRQMLQRSAQFPAVHEVLRGWAGVKPSLEIVYLEEANRFQFELELGRLVRENPTLSGFQPPQVRVLFELWWQKGGRPELIEVLASHPEWQEYGWLFLVNEFVRHSAYDSAYRLAQKYVDKPLLPSAVPKSFEDTERRFLLNSANFADGYQVYRHYAEGGELAKALVTLQTAVSNPNCPSYFYYLEAAVYAELGEWKDAIDSLKRYQPSLLRSE